MTRVEHLEWCKKRAHEYLERGDVANAIASMMSDLKKHPETSHANSFLDMVGMQAAINGSVHDARRFIDGFN